MKSSLQKLLILSIMLFFPFYPISAAEHHPEEFLASIQGSPDAGKQIYTHFCANCHAPNPLINVGAPRLGFKAEWKPYSNQSLDEMVKVIDGGLGAMPPRGGCFECSDKDLKAAINFMLPK